VETGTSLEWGEDWARIEKLIALARNAHRTELTLERRQRIRDQVLDRLERARDRRRTARAFAAGASTMLLAVLLLKLVSGWVGGSSTALARKPGVQQVVAE
jgi:hypothetical protein